jgi:hypothetical protein
MAGRRGGLAFLRAGDAVGILRKQQGELTNGGYRDQRQTGR